MHRLTWVLVAIILAFPSVAREAGGQTPKSSDENINVPGERPFDAVNIFGDLGKIFQLPNLDENKIWWERMVRGEVGRERFLILCALKDGNWKKLGDIRDYVEFQLGEIYPSDELRAMLFLMAGEQRVWQSNDTQRLKSGEGWLERNREASYSGIDSEWRIQPSVLPLLYYLLMGCPTENRCE